MRHDLRRIGRLALFASALLALPPTAPRAQALYDAFVEAVAADRSDQVRALLARGIDPNTPFIPLGLVGTLLSTRIRPFSSRTQ